MGSVDTGNLILQVFGVVVGGGLLQLLIFLIKRKAEVRSLDVGSDVGLLSAAQAQITGLTATEATLRTVITDKEARIATLEKRLADEQTDHMRTLSTCEDNADRLAADLARARSELNTCRYQLEQMTPDSERWPPPRRGGPRHGRDEEEPQED